MEGTYAVRQWLSAAELLRAVHLSQSFPVELEGLGMVTVLRSVIGEDGGTRFLQGYVLLHNSRLFDLLGVLDDAACCKEVRVTPCDDGSYL